jgi:hypothetical protein
LTFFGGEIHYFFGGEIHYFFGGEFGGELALFKPG